MTFLRSISTRRLLAMIFGVVSTCVLGTAIAVAAIGNGPVPPSVSLAGAIHTALEAKPVTAVSANISFTNSLFSGSSIGTSDPLMTGATGRLWATDGHLRIELQTDNGDGQIILNGRSFWAYDPTSNTVYEAVLPPRSSRSGLADSAAAQPTVAAVKHALNHLGRHVDVSGATPTDVGGQPAYSVSLSPRTRAGLIGSAQLAFDANNAVPLDFAVFPRGDTTPALELRATSVSYGTVPLSVFQISPPAGAQVVHVTLSQHHAADGLSGQHGRDVQVVGKGLGSVIVLKHAGSSSAQHGSAPAGPLPLQTVTIDGATGKQLSTSLGTVLEFTRDGASYLLAGSVTPATLSSLAHGL